MKCIRDCKFDVVIYLGEGPQSRGPLETDALT